MNKAEGGVVAHANKASGTKLVRKDKCEKLDPKIVEGGQRKNQEV